MKPNNARNFLNYWLPVILYCAFIFLLSHEGGDIKLPPILFIDKFIHISLYAVLGFLYARAHKWQWKNGVLPGVLIFTFLYGASDEFHQSFVPNRNPSVHDLLADGIGGILGYLLFHFVYNNKLISSER